MPPSNDVRRACCVRRVTATDITITNRPGRGAVRLARLTGGQEVGGSNPLAPNHVSRLAIRSYRIGLTWARDRDIQVGQFWDSSAGTESQSMSRLRKVWIREYRGRRGKTYRVCYFDTRARARRMVRSFKTKRLATAFKNEYENYLNGTGPKPGTSLVEGHAIAKPTSPWSETTAEWIENGATREKTQSTYRSLLHQFGKHTKIACVEEVTESNVERFLASVKSRGRSLATCAAYLRTLAAFFRWTRSEDTPITKKLVSRWTPYKDRKRARPHFFSLEEYESILRACDSISVRMRDQRGPLWWKCFIAVLYHSGLRLNETAHLIWRDIDFEKGILRIRPHVKLKGVFEWSPKGKARRSVPVPAHVMSFLTKIQETQCEGVPYVFLSHTRYHELLKSRHLGPDILYGIGKSFRRIREVAGISEGTIHDLRRTCITNWAAHPALKPKDVQILAGHEDLNTTLDIYAMVEEEDVVEKALKIIHDATDNASMKSSTISDS